MSLPLWRWGTPAVLVASAIAGYILISPSDESGPASAAAPTVPQRSSEPTTRETPYEGLVARLPFVGTLTWRCDGERRFSTQLTLPSPGATVFVSLDADGRRVWRHRQVNPVPDPKRTVVGPFEAARHQTWTIRYPHKPATLKVIARVRFAAPPSRSQCVVSRSNIEVRRNAH